MEYIQTRTYAAREAYGFLRKVCRPLTERAVKAENVRHISEAVWAELIELDLIEVHRTDAEVHVRLIKRDARDVYHYASPEYRGGRKC